MPAESTISDKTVRLELERILASAQFASSPNLSKFIAYVVEAKLNGDEASLKAYSIAVDALGRPETFDSQSDPSVRVLAGRVRSALRDYYAQTDNAAVLRISIPKGSYRPAFSNIQLAQPDISQQQQSLDSNSIPIVERSVIFSLPFWLAACVIAVCVYAVVTFFELSQETQTLPPAASDDHKLSILIKDDIYQSLDEGELAHARRFSSELREALSNNKSVSVILPPKGEAIDAQKDVDFVVSNSWTHDGPNLSVRVELMNARTNALIYSDARMVSPNVELELPSISSTVQYVTRELNSKIFGASIEALAGRDLSTLSAQQLFVLSTWVSGSAKNVLNWEKERIAIARLAIAKDPNFGPPYSVLADKLAYLAAVDGPSNTTNALEEARTNAKKALELAADDANVVFNVAQSHWHSGRIKQAVLAMKRVLELDPNHGLADYFAKVNPYTCVAAPDHVVEEAIAFDKSLSPENPVRWVTLTWIGWLQLNRWEFEKALLAEQKAAQIFEIPYSTMRRATVLHMLGRTEEGIQAVRDQRRNWPNLSPEHFVNVTIPRLCQEFPRDNNMRSFYKSFAEAAKGKL